MSDENYTHGNAMRLGDIIEFLSERDPEIVVAHGFDRPHSYRGYYEDLAFEPEENITIGQMLTACRAALNHTFEGYKGGSFTMTESTDCWIANEGSGWGEGIGYTLLKYMVGEV